MLDPSNQNTLATIDCANHLLAEKTITRIFFSSDSVRLSELFMNRIAPYALITLERKYVNDTTLANIEKTLLPEHFLDNGVTALEDWL